MDKPTAMAATQAQITAVNMDVPGTEFLQG
jgi:hypothetical protein